MTNNVLFANLINLLKLAQQQNQKKYLVLNGKVYVERVIQFIEK